jgi:hypothetical protein
MVKSIIQKERKGKNKQTNKNHQVRNNKKVSLWVKVLELLLTHPILVLAYKQKL